MTFQIVAIVTLNVGFNWVVEHAIKLRLVFYALAFSRWESSVFFVSCARVFFVEKYCNHYIVNKKRLISCQTEKLPTQSSPTPPFIFLNGGGKVFCK